MRPPDLRRFLVENESLERDPALVLRTPKKREALPDVLNRRELARLLTATERDEVWKRHFPGKRERDRPMLALFAFAGLRRSELLGLDWDDVDLERRLLRVRKAKGGRQQVLPVHPALEPLFLDYLRFRACDPNRRSSSASRAAGFRRRSWRRPSSATPTPPVSPSVSA